MVDVGHSKRFDAERTIQWLILGIPTKQWLILGIRMIQWLISDCTSVEEPVSREHIGWPYRASVLRWSLTERGGRSYAIGRTLLRAGWRDHGVHRNRQV